MPMQYRKEICEHQYLQKQIFFGGENIGNPFLRKISGKTHLQQYWGKGVEC